MTKPPKPFDTGGRLPKLNLPTVDTPKLLESDIARIDKLFNSARPPTFAPEGAPKNLSVAADTANQFDALNRLGIAAMLANPGRFGAAARSAEDIKSIGALTRFDSSIGRFIESLRLSQASAMAPHAALSERIGQQSKLLSGLLPTNRPLEELSASWRSVADLVRHSVVDRAVLTARVAERFAVLDQSAILSDLPDASVIGFSRLVHLERASATDDPFGDEIADVYCAELGDPIDYDETDTDEDRRKRFDGAGFNPQLTAFAPDRQIVVVSVAGFGFEPLGMMAAGTDDLDGSASYDENAARIVGRLEREVRWFVQRTLEGLIGPKWVKQRVPGDMLKRWKDRREEALARGEPECPLVFYADFMDLPQLIVRADNWGDAFEPVFRHKDEVEVSFRRIHPMRIAVAHTRPVLAEGVTMLAAEAARVLRLIRRAT